MTLVICWSTYVSILVSTKGVDSTTFLKKLCATYCQRNLQATLFQCVFCGDKAEGLVDQPFILTQTAERATFDQPTPICGKGSLWERVVQY